MRTLFTISLLMLFPFLYNQASAQGMQTLIQGDVSHGGFGGPVVKVSGVDGQAGLWVGGRGGWILNLDQDHAISFGGGGYGLVTNHVAPESTLAGNEKMYASIGYGGFEIEYTNRSWQLAHFTVSSLIGAGGLGLRDKSFDSISGDTMAFFVFEPGMHLELNMTSFFRMAFGISYRLTSGINDYGFRDRDFSGINGILTLKFGSF